MEYAHKEFDNYIEMLCFLNYECNIPKEKIVSIIYDHKGRFHLFFVTESDKITNGDKIISLFGEERAKEIEIALNMGRANGNDWWNQKYESIKRE